MYKLAFPFDSIKSISPDRGHPPYALSFGIIQSAGHNQSPVGVLALISVRPYLKVKPLHEVKRALRTGGAGTLLEQWKSELLKLISIWLIYKKKLLSTLLLPVLNNTICNIWNDICG